MEDRGGEDRIRAAVPDRPDEVLGAGRATGRDDRHVDPRRDRPQERRIEAFAGPVAVDRGHQELAGAQVDGPVHPGQDIEPGPLAAALDDDLPARRPVIAAGPPEGIDGDDDGLATEPAARSG